MSAIKRAQRRVDEFQQRQPVLAFPIAVWKKFGDDQAGNLAALIAYYGFASIFPLLLVFVTVLDIVLPGHPGLHATVLNDAKTSYPFISKYLPTGNKSLGGTGFALVAGVLLTLYGARGVATAAQNAFNTAWEVPLARRPGFPWSTLRAIGLIVVIGVGEIVTAALSGLASGMGHVISGLGAVVAAYVVSLVLNIGLFWLGFRLGTARDISWRELWLGAVISAVIWQILQGVGLSLVQHDVSKSSAVYGTFAVVIGILAFLYLQAELTLYAVEVSVVHARRLWPRTLFPPPLNEQDRRAYELYAKAQQRRPEETIDVRTPDAPASS